MSYQALFDYLHTRMRMSHVYQPVMIKRLLLGNGSAKDLEIAFDLIRMDESQLDYYKERVNQLVGLVLRKNGIVEKSKDSYSLNGIEALTADETKHHGFQLSRPSISFLMASRIRAVTPIFGKS